MHKVKKSNKAWLRYENNEHTKKSNYKPQAHAMVCEENKEKEVHRRKNNCMSFKIFCSERSTFWKAVEEP